jgi:putative SOS response-associated peptidase YedK
MCGRYSLTAGDRGIEARSGLRVSAGFTVRYNIAPTQNVLVVLAYGIRRMEAFRWGLIPSWAKEPKIGHKLINARAATIFEKPSFRAAVRKKRCLVIADGFYEWRQMDKGKIPIHIRLKAKQPFAFVVLWESWISAEGQPTKTCTIVTADPNELMKPIHNRMPAIVPEDLEEIWMDPSIQKKEDLAPVLQPYPSEEM